MSMLKSILLASVALSAPAMAADEPQSGASDAAPAEIVVTAQRREERLIEVPLAVSVVGGEQLERLQAKSFVDYAATVPGLNLTQENPGQTRLILRGINTGSVGSTVAVYLDDVPFGSSGSLANGAIQAGDFDTFDIQRVEVVKGPQGTLYGSNALGGVLKFVTNAPNTTKLEVRGQAGIETTKDGGTGYLGNAVVNIPLGDTLAFRASGFYHHEGGYIDAVGRTGSVRNVNDDNNYGGRASLLFKPSDEFSVRLFATLQNIDVDSPSNFEVDPRTLQPVNALTGARQNRLTRFERIPEYRDARYRLYSGSADYNFGFATLTSVTSYATQKQLTLSDISTNAVNPTTQLLYGAAAGPNNVGTAYQNDLDVKKFTQEVRLASSDDQTFEWLVGGYYTHEKTGLHQAYLPFNLTTQAFIPITPNLLGAPIFVVASIDAKYREYAGFANGTLHLGDRFDISGGVRYSHNKQSSVQRVDQLAVGTPQSGSSSEGVWTWSVSPRLELNDHNSIYVRAAKGYRPGGPNFIPPGAPANFPSTFDSDTVISYEAGLKGETADRTVSYDISAFHVDWKDILILTTANTAAGPVGVNANGRRARTYGVEASTTLRPTRGLSVVANLAFTHAKLRDNAVPTSGGLNLTGGLAGDTLPYVPKWAGNVSADYEWNVGGDAKAFVGGGIRLTGDQYGVFDESVTAPPSYRTLYGRLKLDGYTSVDLRAGVDIGNFTIQAYARNLFDSYGLVSSSGFKFTVPTTLGGTGANLTRASVIRPRTLGATVGFKF
jgi:iron complex outermembrane recepter protein